MTDFCILVHLSSLEFFFYFLVCVTFFFVSEFQNFGAVQARSAHVCTDGFSVTISLVFAIVDGFAF